jgi:hypothetical protein
MEEGMMIRSLPDTLFPRASLALCAGRLKGKFMKKLVCILICFKFRLSSFAGDNSYKVVYDGGSFSNTKAGSDMKLFIEGNNILIKKGSSEVVTIPASSVTEISYGQDVHRRVGAAIGVAGLLAGLEGITGKKAVDSDAMTVKN